MLVVWIILVCCVIYRKDICIMYEFVFMYVIEWFNMVLDDWDDWK